MKKIKITEADIKRLVKKVIDESYGATLAMGVGIGDSNGKDIGMGYGFQEPIISQFSGGASDMELDEQKEEEEETPVEGDEEEEEISAKVQTSSSNFSEADVQAILLFREGEKKSTDLTVNQRKLADMLGIEV